MFRIGDFSRLSQVSVKTLRFYDEIGLLKPSYVDHLTGYRYYAAGLLSRLDRILMFKELGFSLEEIGPLLEGDLNAAQMGEALRRKREELAVRIERERRRLARIEECVRLVEQNGGAPDYQIRIKQVPRQWVASRRDRIDSYDEADSLFDEIHRHLKKHGAAGPSAAIWHACAHQNREIDCEAVVFLNSSVPESGRVKVYELPANEVACVIHQGSDETVIPAYAAVRSWARSRGYAITGPNREL